MLNAGNVIRISIGAILALTLLAVSPLAQVRKVPPAAAGGASPPFPISDITGLQAALDAKQGSITCADTRVLFADGANTPGCDAGLTYNKTTDTLTAGALVLTTPYNPFDQDLNEADAVVFSTVGVGEADSDGVLLKVVDGWLQVREGDDSGYVELVVKELFLSGSNITTIYGASAALNLSGSGSDFSTPAGLNLGGGHGPEEAGGTFSLFGGIPVGTNIAGGTSTISGERSTGNALGGPIVFHTSVPGASGTGSNPQELRGTMQGIDFSWLGTFTVPTIQSDAALNIAPTGALNINGTPGVNCTSAAAVTTVKGFVTGCTIPAPGAPTVDSLKREIADLRDTLYAVVSGRPFVMLDPRASRPSTRLEKR